MLKLAQRRLLAPTQKLIFQCSQSTAAVSDNKKSSLVPETRSDPLEHYDYFGVNKLFTVKTLFDNRLHLGHSIRSLTPQMAPFVYGSR